MYYICNDVFVCKFTTPRNQCKRARSKTECLKDMILTTRSCLFVGFRFMYEALSRKIGTKSVNNAVILMGIKDYSCTACSFSRYLIAARFLPEMQTYFKIGCLGGGIFCGFCGSCSIVSTPSSLFSFEENL